MEKGQAQWPERPRWNPWFCDPPANDFYTAVNWVISRLQIIFSIVIKNNANKVVAYRGKKDNHTSIMTTAVGSRERAPKEEVILGSYSSKVDHSAVEPSKRDLEACHAFWELQSMSSGFFSTDHSIASKMPNCPPWVSLWAVKGPSSNFCDSKWWS